MLNTFLIALAVFVVAFSALAIGVILGKRRLRGSCGGLANLRDSNGRIMCDACTDPSPDCTGDASEANSRSEH